jgi:Uma2 family endonuclease
MLEVPSSLLAERARWGIDVLDEMWEGELHLVPPPSEEHQRIGMELSVVLHSAVQGTGLVVRYETGLFDPHAPGASSYRVPDLVVFAAGQRSDRGVEGEAALVVEIQSPGDESFDKLDFYRRVGVAEVLMIDRDTKEVRHWHRAGDTLAEVDPESGTPAALSGLAVTFQAVDGTLVVSTPDGRTVI